MAQGNPKNPKADPDAKPGAHGVTTGYEAELWRMAGTLRGSMAAAEYKHVVLGPSCPCDPNVYQANRRTRLTIETEINKDTYSGVFAGHGGSVEDQASSILAAHARIPEPRPAGDNKHGWMSI